jgi:hypothetical protein
MQIDKGTCGPEQLHALQAIFDIIWIDLRAGAKTETSDDDIIGKVLESFGITATPYMRVHGL